MSNSPNAHLSTDTREPIEEAASEFFQRRYRLGLRSVGIPRTLRVSVIAPVFLAAPGSPRNS